MEAPAGYSDPKSYVLCVEIVHGVFRMHAVPHQELTAKFYINAARVQVDVTT